MQERFLFRHLLIRNQELFQLHAQRNDKKQFVLHLHQLQKLREVLFHLQNKAHLLHQDQYTIDIHNVLQQ